MSHPSDFTSSPFQALCAQVLQAAAAVLHGTGATHFVLSLFSSGCEEFMDIQPLWEFAATLPHAGAGMLAHHALFSAVYWVLSPPLKPAKHPRFPVHCYELIGNSQAQTHLEFVTAVLFLVPCTYRA